MIPEAAVTPSGTALTKNDFAYRELKKRVIFGEYPPGSVINQALVASSIGISTTPVREALRRLSVEGLVELGAHRDARVTPLSTREARDIYEMRQSLESTAAALASERRSEEDIARLSAAAANLRPVVERAGADVLIAHRHFHSAIYRASGNTLLIETLDLLWDKSDRYRRLGVSLLEGSGETRLQDYNEHFELMQTIIDGDRKRAERIMRHHSRESLAGLVARTLPSIQ